MVITKRVFLRKLEKQTETEHKGSENSILFLLFSPGWHLWLIVFRQWEGEGRVVEAFLLSLVQSFSLKRN